MSPRIELGLLAALLTGACAHAVPAPAVIVQAPPPTPTTTRKLLAQAAAADLGDGPVPITLDVLGTLRAGGRVGRVPLGQHAEAWFSHHPEGLLVVEVDRKRGVRGILVSQPTDDDEDPATHWLLYVIAGGELRPAFDLIIDMHGYSSLRLPGDGSLVYLEDPWQACARAPAGAADGAKRDEVILHLDPSGTKMVDERRMPVMDADCDQLAG